ncbi:hypothetical protein M770_16745 [Pseudomonas aeruginosa VRFPA03]|nr:hypothetical protein M770_16745 [Pseudomonas aeruginosa VRFPA03]
MILGLCLTAMAGLLGYQQYQLIQLRSGVDSAAEKTSLEAILARLNRVDERLDAVDGQHLVSNEDFRSASRHCPTALTPRRPSPSRPPTPSRTWRANPTKDLHNP